MYIIEHFTMDLALTGMYPFFTLSPLPCGQGKKRVSEGTKVMELGTKVTVSGPKEW
jgi:hypothetical protein